MSKSSGAVDHGKYEEGKCNENDPRGYAVHHYCIKLKQHTGYPERRIHKCECGHAWRD